MIKYYPTNLSGSPALILFSLEKLSFEIVKNRSKNAHKRLYFNLQYCKFSSAAKPQTFEAESLQSFIASGGWGFVRRPVTKWEPRGKSTPGSNLAPLKFSELLYILLYLVYFCSPSSNARLLP